MGLATCGAKALLFAIDITWAARPPTMVGAGRPPALPAATLSGGGLWEEAM